MAVGRSRSEMNEYLRRRQTLRGRSHANCVAILNCREQAVEHMDRPSKSKDEFATQHRWSTYQHLRYVLPPQIVEVSSGGGSIARSAIYLSRRGDSPGHGGSDGPSGTRPRGASRVCIDDRCCARAGSSACMDSGTPALAPDAVLYPKQAFQ